MIKKCILCLWIFLETAFASNLSQLQRGAQSYLDYCAGCHSLRYLDEEKMQKDLGVAPRSKGAILTALPPADAKKWFGLIPPDLSLKARQKGSPWLQRYLHSFYPDQKRPFGVNNLLLQNLTMPNVLAALPAKKYEQTVNDIAAFLDYAADPSKAVRHRLGGSVLIFLLVLLGLSYALMKAYWREVE